MLCAHPALLVHASSEFSCSRRVVVVVRIPHITRCRLLTKSILAVPSISTNVPGHIPTRGPLLSTSAAADAAAYLVLLLLWATVELWERRLAAWIVFRGTRATSSGSNTHPYLRFDSPGPRGTSTRILSTASSPLCALCVADECNERIFSLSSPHLQRSFLPADRPFWPRGALRPYE